MSNDKPEIKPENRAGKIPCTASCYTNFSFKCSCNMRTRLVGDGCQICNTEYAIDLLPQPAELAGELIINGQFSKDQANYIASEVYQPLVSLVVILNSKIEQLAKAV